MLPIKDFNYPLLEERIAKYPISPRDSSKLLIYKDNQISEDIFHNIGKHLNSSTLLIYNNTRVIQARLVFKKNTGARIEIFCLEPIAPKEYTLSLSATTQCEWECLVGNAKKWKDDSISLTIDTIGVTLTATKVCSLEYAQRILFSWNNPNITFSEILEAIGELPIPPYLNRQTEESDKENYQTIYSKIHGSVAAPTAGLHFTDKVIDQLRQQGLSFEEITLHVGAGTFRPVKTEDANQHTMHTETIILRKESIQHILDNLDNIIAIGTTTVRTLESLYYLGQQDWDDNTIPEVKQFDPYQQEYSLSPQEALQRLIQNMEKHQIDTLYAQTQIMIKPGYQFRIIKGMITNFHQPQSTLLLLVSALIGENWRQVYQYALDHQFRFLSYGDSSLLFPQ